MILTKNKQFLELFLICLLAICCLLPFAGKAFHIDDTLFIYSARQIINNPFDPYGFDINWYGRVMPAVEVIKNPPLMSYYIAFFMRIFGESELVLHSALMIPFVLLIAGIYNLSRKLCQQYVIATLIGLASPVIMISGTTVMCDIMMVAFYIWAIVFWIEGLERGSQKYLLFSSAIASLCILTKYFGLSLIPLLFVYTIFKQKKISKDLLFLFIPLGITIFFNSMTVLTYGVGLVSSAMLYPRETLNAGMSLKFSKLAGTLVFAGGGSLAAILVLFLIWPAKKILVFIAVIISQFTFLCYIYSYHHQLSWQYSLFFMSGLILLGLSFSDFLKNKNADSLLLLMLMAGTFIFTGLFNWTMNGRNIIPIAAISGILIVRYIQSNHVQRIKIWRIGVAIVLGFLISFSVAYADYISARVEKKIAYKIAKEYASSERALWFEGHWGFQYYMEQRGATALDYSNLQFSQGDIIVVPLNNTNLLPLRKNRFALIATIEEPSNVPLSTMSPEQCAGFYSDVFGSLPFSIGEKSSNVYQIFRFKE